MLQQHQLFEYVKPKLFSAYLEGNRFVLIQRKDKNVKCYQKIWHGNLYQVNVPLTHSLADYAEAMEKSINTVAAIQLVSPLELCVRFSDLTRIIGRIECSTISKHTVFPEISVLYLDKGGKPAKQTVKIPEDALNLASMACHDNAMVDIIGVPWALSPSVIQAKYINLL